ncbi:leucine-rich repeat-domain-containing protein [Podospora australis]|uniref:U2 small nuclear ribonucleoprotein A' n=1 Tax=Podospora australis TaxID=1536484 RepID=A0AAN6WS12_9PEZI|nr:leucine-rich repeat-domain-containing protein [Podospora australis]
MRLTADLINHSLSYLNPLKERELDLRGHRIPAIENLGVAGPHDAIDLTDNDISVLGNFPLSPRIRTLLLARNRIAAIQQGVPTSVPNLRTLNLASNNIGELADLDVLGKFAYLTHLVLLDNPVTKKEYYREWVLWRCPTVRFLDYVKVKQVERERGRELFGDGEAPTELASKIMGIKSKTFDVTATDAQGGDKETSKLSRLKLTEKEKRKLQELIKKASTLEEITRLEKALLEGRLPPGIMVGDEMEE